MVYVAVVLLHQSQGTTIFNRNGGLLQAFNGAYPGNNNRDIEGKLAKYKSVSILIYVDK